MTPNYSKLSGRICEIFETQQKFAAAMGISEHSISKKLNGKICWKQTEIQKACDVLDLAPEDIPTYFFCTQGSDFLNKKNNLSKGQ